MELNFLYTKEGREGKITLNAEELDLTINYSQINRYRPTAADPSSFGWLPIQNGGLRQTLPRYYGTVTHKATYSSLPSSLVSQIQNKFSGNNTYSLNRGANFIDKDQLDNYTGIELYVWGAEGKKKVCNFQWAVVEEDDPQHPGQKILSSYYNGLYSFLCPNPQGELPENSAVGTLSNLQGVHGKYSADAKMALWIITVHDDIFGSPSYGRDFKVLVETFSQPTGFPSTGVIMADMRCLEGAENSPNIINGSDPNKNSTPTGWGGERDTTSNSDIITGPSAILLGSVNFGDHGTFLYRVDPANLEKFEKSLWSNSLMDKFKDYIYSPSSGVLACNALPYSVSIVGEYTDVVTIKMCGTEAKYSNTDFWNPVQNQVPGLNPTYVYAVGNYAWASQQISQTYTDGVVSPAGIYIKPFFNSFLDFEPYTKVQVRLPYIGTVPIPTSSCMGGYLFVNYVTDNRNGNIMAQIYACSKRNYEDGNARGWVLIGQWSGNCATPIPLVGNSMGSSDVVGAIKGFASNAAGTILDDSPTSLATNAVKAGLDMVTARHEPRIIGTLNANAGVLGDGTCRVIISRPVDVTPGTYTIVDGQRVFESNGLLEQKGIASYSGGTVGQYEGVTQGYVLGNINGATEGEMLKIRSLFADGVNIKKVVS